jgi:signal peptidase I
MVKSKGGDRMENQKLSVADQLLYAHSQQLQKPTYQPPSTWKELRGLVIKIGVIIITFLLIFTFLFGFHRNSDPYMAPMVKTGDLVVFYRLTNDYAIGDLLIVEFQGERQIRRVVAKAGDIVDIGEDGLIVNGAIQQEANIFQSTFPYEEGVEFPLTVGEGQVFVLADSREGATDSRIYGGVDVKDAQGTVITIIRRRHF